jgi:hypothetical protein
LSDNESNPDSSDTISDIVSVLIVSDMVSGIDAAVVCAGDVVVGYYCLSNGAIANNIATGKVKRNMPDPIPVMIIGRLAVDLHWRLQLQRWSL